MEGTSWLPAVTVLIAALLAGAVFLVRQRRAVPVRLEREGERDELETRFELMIERLRLLRERGDDEARRESRRTEIAAAGLLRELERTPAHPSAEASSPSSAGTPNRPLRALLWITFVASSAAIIWLLLITSVQDRAPGAPLTGDQSLTGGGDGADAEASLRAQIAANPHDLDARLMLARVLMDQNRMLEVHRQTQGVLAVDPDNARAHSYQAMVLLAMDRPREAEAAAKKALSIDPGLVEGWLHLGLIHFRAGDVDAALGDLEQAKRISPADAPLIERLAQEMRNVAAEAAGSPVAPQAGARFAGTVRVSPKTLEKYRGSTMFITVRHANAAAGPPAGAVRLALTAREIPFRITAEDSMTGAALPDQARLEFRIDADGDPLTRADEPTVTVAAQANADDLVVDLQ